MSTSNVIGSVLGQGRRADEILIASSLERAGTLRKGTIIAHDTVNETILLQIVDKITWADVSDQDLYLMSENEQMAHKILERSQQELHLLPVICQVFFSFYD